MNTERTRRIVLILGTVVTVALALGLITTSVLGQRPPGGGYGYPYGYPCDELGPPGEYGPTCADPGAIVQEVDAGEQFDLFPRQGGLTGQLPFRGRVLLDENLPRKGPAPPPGLVALVDYFFIDINNLDTPGTGEAGPFNPPFRLEIFLPGFAQAIPDGELRGYFHDGSWHSIPFLGKINDGDTEPSLGAGQNDGWFIINYGGGFRSVVILTKHLTNFTAFRDPPDTTGAGGGGGQTTVPLAVSSSVKKTIKVKKNRFRVPCRVSGTGATRCRVQAYSKIKPSKKKKAKRTLIGSGSAALKNGAASVLVKLNGKGKAAIKKGRRRLKSSLVIQGIGSAQPAARVTRNVTLVGPKKKKRKN